jgi:hypothetical protein
MYKREEIKGDALQGQPGDLTTSAQKPLSSEKSNHSYLLNGQDTMIRWARNLKELSKMFDCRPTYAKVPIQRPNKSQRARHSNEVISNLKKPAHLPDIRATSSTFRGG